MPRGIPVMGRDPNNKGKIISVRENGAAEAVQVGNELAVTSAPATGTKTVTNTVAELFAGSSRKTNRNRIIVRNLHQSIPVRIGGSSISDTLGQLLEPGASVEIDFDPATAVPIYAVSTAGDISVEVLEV